MLGSLESEVLAVLTLSGEGGAREVQQELEGRGVAVAYTTVATILGRLHEKRMVGRRRESCRGGTRYVYRTRDFERKYLQNLLEGVVTLFGPAGVVHLNEELAKLRPGGDRRYAGGLAAERRVGSEMFSPNEALLYVPVLVWAVVGVGLALAFRGSAPPLLLRLAAAFLALWALVATTTLLWVIDHGGWGSVLRLALRPDLLFAPSESHLWFLGGAIALLLLAAAFLVNQAVGHGLLLIRHPRAMPWPPGIDPPARAAYLGRFDSRRPEAFSFTLLARAPGSAWRPVRREVILVSDGLLDRLTPAERDAVIAHEAGHLVSLDGRYLTFLRTASRMLRWDPCFALLTSALTRREELRADRIAVGWTGRPEALARALEKAVEAGGSGGLPAARGLLGGLRGRDATFVNERVRRLRTMARDGRSPEDA